MFKYEIDIHHRGSQIRRYGPCVADATIYILHRGWDRPIDDSWFKKAFKALVCDYVEEPDDWYCFTLREFRRIDDNTAYLRAERPYDD